MKDNLEGIFDAISALDDARWSKSDNYNSINYYDKSLTNEKKLLTHWLCYITDRQMEFERIWDIGGYVISHLASEYMQSKKNINYIFGKCFKGDHFECPYSKNKKLEAQYQISKGPVKFKSRFMPSDALSIYRTIYILDIISDRNIAGYIYHFIKNEKDQVKAFKNMYLALNYLSYADIGAVDSRNIRQRISKIPDKLKKDILLIKKSPEEFLRIQKELFEKKRFDKKRLWCSIRDFLKSPAFNPLLVYALDKINPREGGRWKYRNDKSFRSVLEEIELPGDVWNNNPTFNNGLFGKIFKKCNFKETLKTSAKIRKLYDKTLRGKTSFYPEQLDVTFDFVPRMCEKKLCKICMFGNGINEICHKNKRAFCSIALISCGYLTPCLPKRCPFYVDVSGKCDGIYKIASMS